MDLGWTVSRTWAANTRNPKFDNVLTIQGLGVEVVSVVEH